MAQAKGQPNIREQLLEAGTRELNRSGLQNFSVRRVANACGVSCAAPYKHFADKLGFIAAMIDYVNSMWTKRQMEILSHKEELTTRQLLLEISMDYIRFLVENPHFRSIIMFKDDEFDQKYTRARSQMSEITQNIVRQYCKEVNMPEKTALLKTYIVRSLIYGASFMFDKEDMEYNEENMKLVSFAIDRDFDLN